MFRLCLLLSIILAVQSGRQRWVKYFLFTVFLPYILAVKYFNGQTLSLQDLAKLSSNPMGNLRTLSAGREEDQDPGPSLISDTFKIFHQVQKEWLCELEEVIIEVC